MRQVDDGGRGRIWSGGRLVWGNHCRFSHHQVATGAFKTSTIVRVPVHSQHLILRNWCLQDWQCMTSQLFTVSISNVINVTFVINSNNPPNIGNIIAAFKSYFQIVIVIANHIDRHQLPEVGPLVEGLMQFMGL